MELEKKEKISIGKISNYAKGGLTVSRERDVKGVKGTGVKGTC